MHQPKINKIMVAAYAAALCSRSVSGFTPLTSPFLHRTIKRISSNSIITTRHVSSSPTTPEISTTEIPLINNRIPLGSLDGGLDTRSLTNNLDLVLSHLRSRRASPETLEAARRIASRAEERVTLLQTRDAALRTKNEQSAQVGKLMRKSNDDNEDSSDIESAVDEAKALSAAASDEASLVESKLSELESECSSLLASIPNLLDDLVLDGTDESSNEELYFRGDVTALPTKLSWPTDFTPRWHDDVATSLNGYHPEKAAAMSGARFPILSGPIARLERAISSFFLDLHTTEHGYVECSLPLVVSRSALEGTSQLPKFEDDLFGVSNHRCNAEDAFLIPTAEVPLTNFHRGDVLDGPVDLPLSYVAMTPCFRAEAGSHGRDVRGLIRTHQFAKVELVKICTPETSREEHETLTGHAERCLELLELPYRKVRLCSGDVGFGARLCYDLEVWCPGSGEYREISSCSNTGDFQAKKMGLRYRPAAVGAGGEEKEGGGGGKKKKKQKKVKPVFCHTINGSGLAVGRTLVAILENYQMPDGSVIVPDVLRSYMGGVEVLKIDK